MGLKLCMYHLLVAALVAPIFCYGTIIDFSSGQYSLMDTNVAMVRVTPTAGKIRIKCPATIDTETLTHYPKNSKGTDAPVLAYVLSYYDIEVMQIGELIRHEDGKDVVTLVQDDQGTQYIIDIRPGLIVRNKYEKFMLCCASPSVEKNAELLKEFLFSLSRTYYWGDGQEMEHVLWSYDAQAKFAGVNVDIDEFHEVTHGCSNIPVSIFSGLTKFDGTAPVPTCIVDVMEATRVGFYCHNGKIDPPDCFQNMYVESTDGSPNLFTLEDGVHPYMFGPLLIAIYVPTKILKHFEGYCKCISHDPVTNTHKETARIVLRNRKDPVINVANTIMKNLVAPVRFPWHSVTLSPGSVLTIRFPYPGSYNIKNKRLGKEAKLGEGTTLESMAIYNASFFPTDPSKRVLSFDTDTHTLKTKPINEAVAGNALVIDTSRMDVGEIKVKYVPGRPLAVIDQRPFFYTWNLNTSNDILTGEIHASMMINFASNYDYSESGCSPLGLPLFSERRQSNDFRSRPVMRREKAYNHCEFFVPHSTRTAIYCSPGQSLVPEGCKNVAYNASRSMTVTMPVEINSWLEEDTGITYLHPSKGTSHMYSASCSCVDGSGIETVRLDIHNMKKLQMLSDGWYKHYIEMKHVPSVAMEDYVLPTGEMVQDTGTIELEDAPIKEVITLGLGTDLTLRCINLYSTLYSHDNTTVYTNNFIDQYHYANRSTGESRYGRVEPLYSTRGKGRWYPAHIKEHYYEIIEEGNKTKLVTKAYSESFASSSHSFRVDTDKTLSVEHLSFLNIKVPQSSIVISKDHAEDYITLGFACGSLSRGTYPLRKQPYRSSENVTRGTSGHEALLNGNEETSYGSTDDGNMEKFTQVTDMRNMNLIDIVKVRIPVTDPYVHGCGMDGVEDELFRPDTKPMLNAKGDTIGCIVDLKVHQKAGFYCPLPYVTQPLHCGMRKARKSNYSRPPFPKSPIKVTRSSNFYIFTLSKLKERHSSSEDTGAEPFECRCVTTTGKVLSTIQII